MKRRKFKSQYDLTPKKRRKGPSEKKRFLFYTTVHRRFRLQRVCTLLLL